MYNEDDYVLVRDTRTKPGVNSKLKPNYKGPYVVKKVFGNSRYVITDIPGFNLTSRPMILFCLQIALNIRSNL